MDACIKVELESRSRYRALKKQLEAEHKRAGKIQKFKKLIARIGRAYRKTWSSGLEKIEQKVRWLEYKKGKEAGRRRVPVPDN